MNQEQFSKLTEIKSAVKLPASKTPLYGASFTDDLSDRTLLWGYTVDRESFHVFMVEGRIYKTVYSFGEAEPVIVDEFTGFSELIPNKRLYPEACDYDICWYLQTLGLNLPFTNFNTERQFQQFYGYVR